MRSDRLLDEAVDAFAELRKVKPFWKTLGREPLPTVKSAAEVPPVEAAAPFVPANGADHAQAAGGRQDAESKAA